MSRKSLDTTYKASKRPLIDYGDIIYDKVQNESFFKKHRIATIKAALATAGAIQGTSRGKNFQELGLQSLSSRKWNKRISYMFKIMKEKVPNYQIKLISKCEQIIRTRNNHCCKNCIKCSFLHSTLNYCFNPI